MTGPRPDRAAHPARAAGPVAPRPASKPRARLLGTLPVATAFGLILVSLQALEEIYESVRSGGLAEWIDGMMQTWMVAHRQDWLNTVATAYTHLGGKIGMPILATVLVLAMAGCWRTWTPVRLMLVAAAGSLTLTMQGKTLTARARPPFDQAVPPLESSASFPSGHTLNAVVVATVLAYLMLVYVVSRAARILAVIGVIGFCALMGLSRIYLGHHWLSDVLAGAAAGLAWGLAVVLGHWLYVRLRTRHRAPTVRHVAQQHRRSQAR